MKRVPAIIALALSMGAFSLFGADLTFEEALCLRRLVNYLEARDLDVPDAEGDFYSSDSRVWFEEKKGPGRKRSAGKGPWSAWDDFFNSETVYLTFHVEDRTAAVVMLESNDFYKLIDRAPSKVRVTYEFDPAGFVTSTLVQGMESDGPDSDRLDEFEAWCAEKYPDKIAFLMPDNRISPELERAKVWKELLVEWRQEVGLPPID